MVARVRAWPIPEAQATTLEAGRRRHAASAERRRASSRHRHVHGRPDALPATFYEATGGGNGVWRADVQYDWQSLPDGTGLGYVTAPLADDTVVVGSGSVDLWMQADAADTDIEVTITEVRPDGTEIYVQSGWLRASQRALDDAASTELHPDPHPRRGRRRRAARRRVHARARRRCSRSPTRSAPAADAADDRRTGQQPGHLGVPHDRRRRDGHGRPRRRAAVADWCCRWCPTST